MIVDASPLIVLSKINRLSLLKVLFAHIVITPQVRDEVLVKDKPGNIVIESAMHDGWIRVVTPRETLSYGLGKGEESALSLAKENREILLVDDGAAIRVAKLLGVETVRTSSIIVFAVKRKFLTKDEAIVAVDAMIECGYYIHPVHYSEIRRALDEIV